MLKKEVTAKELLENKGFLPIKWCGKYEADKVSMDTYDVQAGGSGMYGLVFDNTFSKQTSKMATFVILTYPIGQPPQSSNNLPNIQIPKTRPSQSSLAKTGVATQDGDPTASVDSFHSNPRARAVSLGARSDGGSSLVTHVGTLSKRRRKKGQGYARRFFSLDYSSCTLSYYYNRNSSALRGAIPLSLAAVAADERRREITIDSGAEIWHLRAPNAKEFLEWARALERASRIARGLESLPSAAQTSQDGFEAPTKTTQPYTEDDSFAWQQVETLVSRVVGTRDALRRLTKEVAALPRPPSSSVHLTPGASTPTEGGEGYFQSAEKKSFWRRKSSAPALTPIISQQQADVPAVAVVSPGPAPTADSNTPSSKAAKRRSRGVVQEERSLHDHCQALLADLDSVVNEFSTLISTNKRRRKPVAQVADGVSRLSMDSVSTTDEFFDAEDTASRVLRIGGSDDESDEESEHDDAASVGNSSISSVDGEETVGPDGTNHLFPARSKVLSPLPIEQQPTRRKTIPRATTLPPSLIAFVRKNVGKDLSTISMPVSSNEPLSLLQKLAEQVEYSQLLDQASKQTSVVDRLLHVTAFAVSQFSGNRARERAIRKPFNPLLGETFELVRTENEVPGGLRLLVEKVQHRPVKLAIHAESATWSLAQSPAPGQKFWGKSAEITTEGRVRVVLRLADGKDELYSWDIATMFLRNVVMGEKYVEPVGTMTVVNDTTGHKGVVEFRAKGMFGGRSEEVNVECYGPDGRDVGSGMSGTWTGGLRTTGKAGAKDLWKVGSLVDNAAQTYGMTTFAATLNEITELEKGNVATTDSRLRPDQRLAEDGKLDDAEVSKKQLEEAQRDRRRVLEESAGTHRPRWFAKIEDSPDGEEVWKIKTGKDSYWEERERGSWTGVQEIFTSA